MVEGENFDALFEEIDKHLKKEDKNKPRHITLSHNAGDFWLKRVLLNNDIVNKIKVHYTEDGLPVASSRIEQTTDMLKGRFSDAIGNSQGDFNIDISKREHRFLKDLYKVYQSVSSSDVVAQDYYKELNGKMRGNYLKEMMNGARSRMTRIFKKQ